MLYIFIYCYINLLQICINCYKFAIFCFCYMLNIFWIYVFVFSQSAWPPDWAKELLRLNTIRSLSTVYWCRPFLVQGVWPKVTTWRARNAARVNAWSYNYSVEPRNRLQLKRGLFSYLFSHFLQFLPTKKWFLIDIN